MENNKEKNENSNNINKSKNFYINRDENLNLKQIFQKNNLFETEKNLINQRMKNLENEFLSHYDKQNSTKFIIEKKHKIKEFLRNIQSKDFISLEDYRTFKNFSLEKGGFLYNEYRQKIYQKIFFLDKRDLKNFKILKIDKNLFEGYDFFDWRNQFKIKGKINKI
jgi:hypothetical protein